MEEKDGCVWPYFIIVIIALCILYCGSRSDNEKKDLAKKEKQNIYNSFIDKLDFDPDSLLKSFEEKQSQNGKYVFMNKKTKPIFLFEYYGEKKAYVFDSSAIDNNYSSYKLKDINAIGLITRSIRSNGTYDNGRTVAGVHVLQIVVYDKYSGKYLNQYIIEGGDPPSEVNYRRNAPDTITGSFPRFNYEELFESLK